MAKKSDISELRLVFSYDPLSGIVLRRDTGKEAGHVNKSTSSKWPHEYRHIRFLGNTYMTHRLAYALHFGEWPNVIDHIDGDTLNNRIENLRSVDHRANRRNSCLSKANTTGVSGVRWGKKENKWVSRISFLQNGKVRCVHLVQTLDLFEAICRRKSAEVFYGFHENHGRPNGFTSCREETARLNGVKP